MMNGSRLLTLAGTGLAAFALTAAPAAAQEHPETQEVTVQVAGAEGEAGSGVVHLAAAGAEETNITLQVSDLADGALEVVLVNGSCAAPGEARAPLGNVDVLEGAGEGAFVASAPYEALVAGPVAVQFVRSGDDAPLLCGDVITEVAAEDEAI